MWELGRLVLGKFEFNPIISCLQKTKVKTFLQKDILFQPPYGFHTQPFITPSVLKNKFDWLVYSNKS